MMAKLRSTAPPGGTSAEKLFEEIAEPRAFELELIPFSSPPAGPATRPVRRRPRIHASIPIGTQLVVFPATFRIAQHLIGLVDFLEFLLRRLFVFGDVRMILAGQLAEALLDVFLRRLRRHPEHLVIIFEFNGHGVLESDHPPPLWKSRWYAGLRPTASRGEFTNTVNSS